MRQDVSEGRHERHDSKFRDQVDERYGTCCSLQQHWPGVLSSTWDVRYSRNHRSFAQTARSCDEDHKFYIATTTHIGDMLLSQAAASTLTLDLKTANPSKGGDAKPPV